MATNKMIIQLNREQRVFLLKSLKDGCVDLDALDSVGIRPASRFDNMTDEELENEIVRMQISTRSCEDGGSPQTERICKGCYQAGSCWLSWRARDDRELDDKIRDIMKQAT